MIKHNIVTNFLLLYDRHGRHCRKFERERKEDLQFLFRPIPAAGFNSKTIKQARALNIGIGEIILEVVFMETRSGTRGNR